MQQTLLSRIFFVFIICLCLCSRLAWANTPVAEYHFNETAWTNGIASHVLDSSSNYIHGTPQGPSVTTGKVCGAANFSNYAFGTGTRVEATRSAWATTSASATHASYRHTGIIDLSAATTVNWWNSGSLGGWVQVDLGQSYWLERVELYGSSSYPESFTVSISQDGVTWTAVTSDSYKVDNTLTYSATLGNYGASYDIATSTLANNLQARYVRYTAAAHTNWGYLREMAVWGKPVQSLISVTDNAALDFSTTYSIAAWVKTTKVSGTIVAKTNANSPFTGYVFAIGPDSGGKLALWSNNAWNISTGTAVNDGLWHHVAVTVSGTYAQFYVDGVANGPPLTLTSATTVNTAPLRIGLENNDVASAAVRYFDGQMDELLLFNTYLSASDIDKMYDNHVLGKNHDGTTASCTTSPVSWLASNGSGGYQITHNGVTTNVTITTPAGTTFDSVTNYYQPSGTYRNLNPTGTFKTSAAGTVTITFDKPVKNPHITLFSVGTPWSSATYSFSAPYEVVSFGRNSGYAYFSCIPGVSNILMGKECNGIVKFEGTYRSLSFTVTAENWHGFNVGVNDITELIGEYHFEENNTWNGTANELTDSSGYNRHGNGIGSPAKPSRAAQDPAIGNNGTCDYAQFPGPYTNGGAFQINSLPISTTVGDQTTVSFWMYWDGTLGTMPIGWNAYNLQFMVDYSYSEAPTFGFNTGNGSDIWGINAVNLLEGWHHVVAIFTNGDVTKNKLYIDGLPQTLTKRSSTAALARNVSSTLVIGGWPNSSSQRYTGYLDEIKVYRGALTSTDVTALYAEKHTCNPGQPTELLAEFRFEEPIWTGAAGELKDHSGNGRNGVATGTPLPSPGLSNPAKTGSNGTCGYANMPGPWTGGGTFEVSNLPVATTAGTKNSVSFWMYWDGKNLVMPIGWDRYDLAMINGYFGFNSSVGDLFGVAMPSNLANGWHHVVAVFANGNVQQSKLYLNGVAQTLSQLQGTPNNTHSFANSTFRIGGWSAAGTPNEFNYRFSGRIDEVKVYSGELSQAEVSTLYNETHACKSTSAATLVAAYHFEDQAWSASNLLQDSINNYDGTLIGTGAPTPEAITPARPGTSGTCGYANMPGPVNSNGAAFNISGLPLSNSQGAQTTISFWMYWDGTASMPVGWGTYVLYLEGNKVVFNTNNVGDRYGVSTPTSLANGWHHIVAVFTNGHLSRNQLYINGVAQKLSHIGTNPIHNYYGAFVGGDLRVGGRRMDSFYRFAGKIDELRIFNGAVTPEQAQALFQENHDCIGNGLLAEYNFEDSSWNGTPNELIDSSGNNYHGQAQGSPSPSVTTTAPARSGTTGTCGYATFPGPSSYGPSFVINNLPVSTTVNEQTTVSFWMYWNGVNDNMPLGWRNISLWFYNNAFGFNTKNSDIYGFSSAGLANGWYHVVAVFTNGDLSKNKLYINGQARALTQQFGTPVTANTTVNSTLTISGFGTNGNSRFQGRLDEVKVYNRELSLSEVSTLYNETHKCYSEPIAAYHFEEAGWNGTAGELKDSSGNNLNGTASAVGAFSPGSASPAKPSGTCGYAILNSNGGGPASTGGKFTINNLPVNTAAGAKTSVSFWMYYDGSFGVMPIDFGGTYDLELANSWIGFNSYQNNVYGHNISLANSWQHVVAVFNNGDASKNKIYINGESKPLGVISNSIPTSSVSSTLYVGGSKYGGYNFGDRLDELKIFNKELTPSEVSALYNETHSCSGNVHHLRLNHNGNGLTCTASKVTIQVCASADQASGCVTDTAGISGTLVAQSSDAKTILASVPFVIPAGGSTIQVDLPVTSAQIAILSVTNLSRTPTDATTCWAGSQQTCRHEYFDSGFLFNVPDHVADVAQTITISAVKKADNSLSCVPAFANVSKSVNFVCSYSNPVVGTLPVRVAGDALNLLNNSASCSSGGRDISLAFNSSGIATTSVQYADAGQIVLSASHRAAGNDGGLVMIGSDSFITAPKDFAITSSTTPPIKAGNNYSVTVTARNNSGNATPNFGREAIPATVNLSFAKTQPTGSGSVNGSFTGSIGTFSNGVASGSNFSWSEVGSKQISASLSNSNYLGSGLNVTGNTIIGPFIPNHFETSLTPACSSGNFTYSRQPYNYRITARNLQNGTTQNYDGSANTSPNQAKTVTLSEVSSPTGSLSANAIVSGSFVAGIANVTLSYQFTNRETPPTNVTLRSNNADGVSSAGTTEPAALIYSGRARMFNANGSVARSLPSTVRLEYWNGSHWTVNNADTCTTLNANNFSFVFPTGSSGKVNYLNACDTAISLSGSAPVFNTSLSAPGNNNKGWAQITLNISNNSFNGQRCTTPGAAIGPDLPASRPWLSYPWATGRNAPAGIFTFGITQSSRVLMRREVY